MKLEQRDLIKKKVSSFREAKEIKKEGANNVIDVIAKFPNPIRIPVVGLLIWMDKKDLCLGCLNEQYPTEIPEGLEAETYYKP